MSSRGPRRGWLGVAWALVGISGAACSPVLSFTSAQSIADGMEGKSWGEVYSLELGVEYDEDDSVPRTFNTFDLKASGDWIALATTLYDGALGKYQGVLRTYRAGEGWGDENSALRGVTSSTINFDLSSLISDARGQMLAVFLSPELSGALTPIQTLLGVRGEWSTRYSSTQTSSDSPDFPGSDDRASDLPRHQGDFDSLGQVWWGNAHNQKAWEVLWDRTHGVGTAVFSKSSTTSQDGVVTPAFVETLSDGRGVVCTSYEHRSSASNPRRLMARCRVLSDATLGESELVATSEFAGLETLGHDGASNHEGLLVYVSYRKVSGTWIVTANTIDEGNLSDPVEISVAMTDLGYDAAPVETTEDWNLQTRPRVVYLGDDRFLAVWQGIAGTSSGNKVSQFFSASYDARIDEWSEAEPFGDEATYSILPPHFSFSVFSNEANNAGIAVNRVDGETGRIHTLSVARYHFFQSWLEFENFGAGCDAQDSFRQCSMTPQGGILDSGESAVAFVDQDDDGVFRLLGVNFE